MGKRQQRRDAEMANQASALAEEAMVVWRVMSWYRKGAEPVFGAPLRCPECGAFCLVLRVDGREGRARNRCSECDHEFYITERAIEAVLSGRMARPNGLVLPGEVARNAVAAAAAADAQQQQPMPSTPGDWSSARPPEFSPAGYPAPVQHTYPQHQHGYPPQPAYPPGQHGYSQPYAGSPGPSPQGYPPPQPGYPPPDPAAPAHTFGGPHSPPHHAYPPAQPGYDNGLHSYPPPQPGYPPADPNHLPAATHHQPPPDGYPRATPDGASHHNPGPSPQTYPPAHSGPSAHPGHGMDQHGPHGPPPGYGNDNVHHTYPPPPPGYRNDNGHYVYPPPQPGYPPAVANHPPAAPNHQTPPDGYPRATPDDPDHSSGPPPQTYLSPQSGDPRTAAGPESTAASLEHSAQPSRDERHASASEPSTNGPGAFRRGSSAGTTGRDVGHGLDERLSSFVADGVHAPSNEGSTPTEPPAVLPTLDRRRPSRGDAPAPSDAPASADTAASTDATDGARRTTTDVTHQRRRKVAEDRRSSATPEAARPTIPAQVVAGPGSGPATFGPVVVTDADGQSWSVDPSPSSPQSSVRALVDQGLPTPSDHGATPTVASAPSSSPTASRPSPTEPARPRSSLFHVPKPTVEVPLDNGDESPLRILLVEDDPGDAALIQSLLTTAGPDRVELRVASSRRDGEAIASEYQPDVVLLDLDLPDSHGLATITRWCFSDTPGAVIVMSGDWSEQIEARGREQGVADFVSKERMIKMLDDGPAGTESMLELLRSIRAAV